MYPFGFITTLKDAAISSCDFFSADLRNKEENDCFTFLKEYRVMLFMD